MGLRQRKRVKPVRYVSVGRPAVEHQMSAESDLVRGLYQVTEIRRSGCGPHLVDQQSHFVGDTLSHWKPVKWPEQRPGIGATPALAEHPEWWHSGAGLPGLCRKMADKWVLLLVLWTMLVLMWPGVRGPAVMWRSRRLRCSPITCVEHMTWCHTRWSDVSSVNDVSERRSLTSGTSSTCTERNGSVTSVSLWLRQRQCSSELSYMPVHCSCEQLILRLTY